MQSRESELDSIWLCLKKVAQPGQPVKLFTTNNTDPDEHYLWTLHGATAHRMWGREWAGRETWRLGCWRQAGHSSCLWPQTTSKVEAPLDFCECLPRQQQPYFLRPAASAISAPLLPFLRAEAASLERQRRARHVS